jgi:hypothetical protein
MNQRRSNLLARLLLRLGELRQDIGHGCRMLANSPAFTTVAVLSLAIGIGVNCAIFSFADALLLRPIPVARPNEVVTVGSTSAVDALGESSQDTSYLDYVDIRDRCKSFAGLVAFSYFRAAVAVTPSAATFRAVDCSTIVNSPPFCASSIVNVYSVAEICVMVIRDAVVTSPILDSDVQRHVSPSACPLASITSPVLSNPR